MKILQVITSLRTGGAEKLMVDLIPRMKQMGHVVDLLIFDGIDTPFKKDAEKVGIKIFDLGKGGSVYSPLRLIKLFPFLNKYDIIHTHNTAPQFFAALGKFGRNINLITTEHNTTNRRRNIKGLKPFDKWMYRQYNHIINISQKAEDNLRKYLGEINTPISTINNGIDFTKFAQAFPSNELEELAPNSKKIMMVAGFRDQKDHPTAIKALKFLHKDFHLFLVGDGSRRKEFENLVSTENLINRIHFLGIREDIPELLKASDYVVLSSHYEGLSLSSVEGMAAGKPFLASNVEGLSDVVKGAGLLFPHEDAKALASKVMELDSSAKLYEEVSNRCSLRAKDFDIKKTASQYNDIYKAIENQKF